MRTSVHQRNTRTNSLFSWNWIIISVSLIGILILINLFSGNDTGSNSGNALNVEVQSGSEVYIKPENGSQKQINSSEKLYTTDASLSVSKGIVHISSSLIDGYLSASPEDGYKNSEISYKEHQEEGEKIELIRGHVWIESHGKTTILLKNFEATITDGSIAMAEQPNQIFSTIYALKGNIQIVADGKNYTLSAGKKIMIAKSDLANPGTTFDMLAGPIEDSLKKNPLFIFRNGDTLLGQNSFTNGASGDILSGSILGSGSSISGSIIGNNISKNYISITSPADESIISTPTIDIVGKILSSEVKRVTINDVDAVVSPVDESFSLKGITVTGDIMNIVYKVYSKDSVILERGVLSLYPKNRQSGTEKLTPTNFPVNDKDYKILNPTENPYKTTDSSITVSGVVPKNTVQYIMVNNFRLKKFVPNSTTWYYYANADYDTMKEGINLYEIVFYGTNDQVLHKQLFTIVKESKTSVSGEIIR